MLPVAMNSFLKLQQRDRGLAVLRDAAGQLVADDLGVAIPDVDDRQVGLAARETARPASRTSASRPVDSGLPGRSTTIAIWLLACCSGKARASSRSPSTLGMSSGR